MENTKEQKTLHSLYCKILNRIDKVKAERMSGKYAIGYHDGEINAYRDVLSTINGFQR